MKRKTIEARKAVQSVIGLLAVAWIGLAAAGCGIEDTNGSKIEDVEFTVLEEESVPEELKQEIEERKEMDFKLTYEDNGKLYIARGYGEKETGGYSISVKKELEQQLAVPVLLPRTFIASLLNELFGS